MNLTTQFAAEFARDWVEAWNAHDLPRVLAHYADDFIMSSPFIAPFTGEATGQLQGKADVTAYWQQALQRLPDLRFELLHVLTGATSVVIHYRTSFGRTAAEVFFFNAQGLVTRAAAHYCND